jgi:hypothetical protein
VNDQTQKISGPKYRVVLLISRYTNEKHVGNGYKADGDDTNIKKKLDGRRGFSQSKKN